MSPQLMQLIMIVGLFAIMYFLLIRPQRKQEKRIAEMRKNIKVGDDIITIGGICGKVVKVKEDKFTIQVGADKTKFDITKWAVSSVEKAAPESKKRTTGELEEEKKEKKVSSKNIKKLGASKEKEEEEQAEAVAEPVVSEPETAAEPGAQNPEENADSAEKAEEKTEE